ncbi:TIGR00282 family metallophosphoesterase [Roseibacillus ishigakijimensis]|uniref:TIGR00282 family metallophosphoesterase n=1 Tax=Roseibacillus ishigakijimensis TaxID=454146 RepID=A0A934VNY0_9BACT|nr:TIGR00282 family metallophosphoesterase [Roseibacillus ishigakijimensis]MBK1835531.1 TIGR00282 family metallophosphoesterase [Roseibacillus ishigakijimensis]
MRILFLGDIVGEPGRSTVFERLPSLRKEEGIDFVIANGENIAGGRGITPKLCIELLRAGIAVVTTGDHVWDQKEIVDYFAIEPRLLRPLNWPAGTAGAGSVVLETDKGKVGVVNAQGRVFMQPPLEDPFVRAEEEVDRLREQGVKVIFVDFHAEATSEKIAFGHHLDGKVSAVAGTHTHVQTADERLLPGGTAAISDVGMCGPHHSVLGRAVESVVWRFRTGMPTRFPIAKGPVELGGLIVDVDPESGKALAVKRFREIIADEEVPSA